MHCSLVDIYQCRGGTCCLASKHHTPEDSIFIVIIVTISDSYHYGILSTCPTPAVCIKYLYRNTGENSNTLFVTSVMSSTKCGFSYFAYFTITYYCCYVVRVSACFLGHCQV